MKAIVHHKLALVAWLLVKGVRVTASKLPVPA